MSFFASKNSNNRNELVIIAESGAIDISLVKFYEGENPKIIFGMNEETVFLEELDAKRLETRMLSTLKRVGEKIISTKLTDSDLKPDIVRFVLGSPWHIPLETNAVIKKDKPFIISENELLEAISIQVPNSENTDIVDQTIISVTANGYELKDLKGKKAQEVEIKAITNVVDKKLKEKISEIIEIFLPHTKIRYESITSLSSLGISKLIKKNSYLLLIPDHEVADMLFIREGVIKKIASVPYGKNYFIRILMDKSLSPIYEDAKSAIALFANDKLNDEKSLKIKNELLKSIDPFIETIRKVIWEGLLEGPVEGIYVLSNSIESQLMWQVVAEDPYCKGSFGKDPELVFIEPNMFKEFISRQETDQEISEEMGLSIMGINSLEKVGLKKI